MFKSSSVRARAKMIWNYWVIKREISINQFETMKRYRRFETWSNLMQLLATFPNFSQNKIQLSEITFELHKVSEGIDLHHRINKDERAKDHQLWYASMSKNSQHFHRKLMISLRYFVWLRSSDLWIWWFVALFVCAILHSTAISSHFFFPSCFSTKKKNNQIVKTTFVWQSSTIMMMMIVFCQFRCANL